MSYDDENKPQVVSISCCSRICLFVWKAVKQNLLCCCGDEETSEMTDIDRRWYKMASDRLEKDFDIVSIVQTLKHLLIQSEKSKDEATVLREFARSQLHSRSVITLDDDQGGDLVAAKVKHGKPSQVQELTDRSNINLHSTSTVSAMQDLEDLAQIET